MATKLPYEKLLDTSDEEQKIREIRWLNKASIIMFVYVAIAWTLITYLPSNLIFGPKEIAAPESELFKPDHSDIKYRDNAVNETLALYQRYKANESASKYVYLGRDNSMSNGVKFVGYLSETLNDGFTDPKRINYANTLAVEVFKEARQLSTQVVSANPVLDKQLKEQLKLKLNSGNYGESIDQINP